MLRVINTRNKSILREMVAADFKVRYQGSLLGYLWSLLKPLFTFIILFAVFTYVIPLGKTIPHYAIQLFIGVVFWNFFSEATATGLSSVVSSGDIIRKISIPRYLIVIAGTVSSLINLALNLLVLFVFILIDGVTFRMEWFLLPLIIIQLYVFAQALAFFLAAATVRFRDVQYIWELILQAGFYATPIIYTALQIPESLRGIFLLSPMAQMIQDARWMIIGDSALTLTSTSGAIWMAVPLGIIAVISFVAVRFFKKQSLTFAEDI